MRWTLNAKGVLSGPRLRWFLRLVTINHKLVADLGPAAKDGMSRQFEDALCLGIGHSYSEGAHQFAKSHHLKVLVHQDKIEGKQHSDGVDGVGGHDPSTAIGRQRSLAQQAG